MHGTAIFFKRRKLYERALIIQAMDKAIIREGGVSSLQMDVLKKSCFIRGKLIFLNIINLLIYMTDFKYAIDTNKYM